MDELATVGQRFAIKRGSLKRPALIEAITRTRASKQTRLAVVNGKLTIVAVNYEQSVICAAKGISGRLVRISSHARRVLDDALGLFFLDDPRRSSYSPAPAVEDSATGSREASGGATLQRAGGATNLSKVILSGLGRIKYAPYNVIRETSVFADRASWLSYVDALSFEGRIDDLTSASAPAHQPSCEAILGLVKECRERLAMCQEEGAHRGRASFLVRFTSEYVHLRTLSALAAALERVKSFREANEVYAFLLAHSAPLCLSHRSKWWMRLVLNSDTHLKDPAGAFAHCTSAIADPFVRMGRRFWLERRLRKLARRAHGAPAGGDAALNGENVAPGGTGKRAKRTGKAKAAEDDEAEEDESNKLDTFVIRADPIRKGKSGRKLAFALLDGSCEGSVEDFALDAFLRGAVAGCEGRRWRGGFHCECRVFTTIFALLFWDILFADEPDVFQTPFQIAPLDLFTDAFYHDGRRTASIRARLAELCDEGPLVDRLVETYATFHGCQVIGLDWEAFPLGALVDICRAIGGASLSAILSLFAQDYRNTCSGIPDLILYGDGDYLLVEVKSTNDRLSDAQLNWNLLFAAHGIKVALCKVLNEDEAFLEYTEQQEELPSEAAVGVFYID